MNYVIPHVLLAAATEAAKAHASPQRQRAIDKAAAVLASEPCVFVNQHGGVTLDSPSGSTYVSNGVACDCPCNHSRYACWPREAARLVKRLQAMEAKQEPVDKAEVYRAIEELWA